ncbi:polyprenyl synthetase family protein [Luteimicrobium sp. NPDC057192]|uniref:polyprenyl synthetase family protein n=1 Tax=Luteimicrobium sp. NPDC057192 TaxID=3346042 RepID=UPI00362A275C
MPDGGLAAAADPDLLLDVEAALRRHVDDARARARSAGPAAEALWDDVRDATRGGKRLRPRLLLATHRALGGVRDDAALQLAVALELLHTAFCLHDDVIDRDVERHGRPTVAARYTAGARAAGASPSHADACGVAAGILAGDLALTLATRLVATAPVDASSRHRLLDRLDDVVQRSAAGELDDVLAVVAPVSTGLTDVLRTASRKTAEYTVVAPVVLGAELAGATPELVDVLRVAGRSLGVAFQLGDDLLGTFGDERVTGKSARSDLAEGKVTALVVLARRTTAWPEVAAHLGDEGVSVRDARRVRSALERAGVRAELEDLVRRYAEHGTRLLDDPVVPPSLRQALAPYARSVVARVR